MEYLYFENTINGTHSIMLLPHFYCMTSYLHVSVRGMLRTNSCYAMPKYSQGHVYQQHSQGYFLQPYTAMYILDNGTITFLYFLL